MSGAEDEKNRETGDEPAERQDSEAPSPDENGAEPTPPPRHGPLLGSRGRILEPPKFDEPPPPPLLAKSREEEEEEEDDEALPDGLAEQLHQIAETPDQPASRWGKIIMIAGLLLTGIGVALLAVTYGISKHYDRSVSNILQLWPLLLLGLIIVLIGFFMHRHEQRE